MKNVEIFEINEAQEYKFRTLSNEHFSQQHSELNSMIVVM